MTDPRPIWDEQDYAHFQARGQQQRAAQPQSDARRGGGDLRIVSEDVMCAIPRGDEELRVTFTRARTGAGKEVAWHSIRVFYPDGAGAWKPGKQGVTVRGRELAAIAAAFSKAVSGGQPLAESAQPPAPRELMPDEEYRRRRGEPAR